MQHYNPLSLLLVQDSYGYEIGQNIKDITKGVYTIKETTLYSTFTRLEKQGHILSYQGDKTHGRARTYYQVTESGRDYYLSKKEEWHLVKEVMDIFTKEINYERN